MNDIEAAEDLLGEISNRSCRLFNLCQAIVTLSDREVNELGLNDLQAINEIAEVARDITSEIIAASEPADPIGRRRARFCVDTEHSIS